MGGATAGEDADDEAGGVDDAGGAPGGGGGKQGSWDMLTRELAMLVGRYEA